MVLKLRCFPPVIVLGQHRNQTWNSDSHTFSHGVSNEVSTTVIHFHYLRNCFFLRSWSMWSSWLFAVIIMGLIKLYRFFLYFKMWSTLKEANLKAMGKGRCEYLDKTHIRQAFVSSLLPHWVHSCTLQRDELPEERLAELSPAWKLYLYTLLVCFITY